MAARRDPVRTTAVLVPALLALALVPLLLRQTYRTVITSTQGRAQPTVPPATQLPPTPASLLVLDDPQGRPVTAALLAPRPNGAGGLLLVLPLGTQTVGATGQTERLDAAFATTGLDGFARSVEGLFGITIAAVAELGATDTATVIAPLTPITVSLTDPVRSVVPGGATAVVAPAGTASLGGPEAAAVLTARADESELVRLDRVRAVWQALLGTRRGQDVQLAVPAASSTAPTTTTTAAAVVDGATTTVAAGDAPSTSTATPAAAFSGTEAVVAALGSIATGANQVRVLTEQVVADTVGTPDERFVADPATMRLLVAEVLPGAVSPANGNLRLRVLNPSGDESVAYQAVAKLTFVSANVIVVDNTPGPVPETSALTYADGARAAEMSGLVPVIGTLSIATTDERIDGVDATVTLGLDFVNATKRANASTTTTTAAVPPTTIDTTTSTIAEITTTTKKTS